MRTDEVAVLAEDLLAHLCGDEADARLLLPRGALLLGDPVHCVVDLNAQAPR